MNELRPYLSASLVLHLLIAVAIAHMGLNAAKSIAPIYSIDFVGPSAVITTLGEVKSTTLATPRTAQAATSVDTDSFGRRRKHHPFILPRPSLLRGLLLKEPHKSTVPALPAQSAAAAPTASAAQTAASAPGGDAGVTADMPNFPYPWFISQVRASIWARWSTRMPAQEGQAVIVFSLRPDGSVVDVRTEVSSGDAALDLTALGAVQDAAPYPPLPHGFNEPFLKIHVTLKSGG